MPRRRYDPFRSVIQAIAASPPGAWFFSRLLHHLDRLTLAASGGRATLSGVLAGLPTVTVTTTGAKSGQPRSVPLIAIEDPARPERLALIGTNWGQAHLPAWVHNLRAHPHAIVARDGRARAYAAHAAEGAEYDYFWQLASELYLGYPLYKQRIAGRRPIPIWVLEPAPEA